MSLGVGEIRGEKQERNQEMGRVHRGRSETVLEFFWESHHMQCRPAEPSPQSQQSL